MNNEFQQLLQHYEDARRTGQSAYFDADDLLDIIDWYIEEERDGDASEAISFARHLHPANFDIDLAEARLRIYQGDYDAATEIINHYPTDDNPDFNLMTCDIMLHQASLHTGETREKLITLVESGYEEVLRIVDFDPSYFSSVISQHSRNEFFAEANSWTERAFNLYPDHPAILDAAALSYALQGDAVKAIDFCNRLIDYDPYDARSWGIMGDICHDFGDYTQALDAYDYVKAIRPDESLSEQNMADCHLALGHYAEAYRLYNAALSRYTSSQAASLAAVDTNYITSRLALCKRRMKENNNS